MSPRVPTIAAVMTVHNRRDLTLTCLRSLLTTQTPTPARITVFLVDDGCTDGTGAAVAEQFPDVVVIAGTGSLFWAAGMALAESRALETGPDLLLWLNDDVTLDPDAIVRLLAVHEQHPDAIIVGATRDPVTGRGSFGARSLVGHHPQRFASLPPCEEPQVVEAFNGNIVLVPRIAHQRVGPIDGSFAHAYADDDYSLRALRSGVPAVACASTLGTCEFVPSPPLEGRTPLARWRALQAPTRRPWHSQVRYLRRHAGWRWPWYLMAGYAKVTLLQELQ